MTHAYAPVIAEQARIRQDDQAALQRRHGLRQARRRCEDLTELLGALDAERSPTVAAQLRATARAAARELYGLVAGPHPLPTRRQKLTAALPDLIEQLDEALYDVRSGFRASHRVALDLAAVVVAGTETLCSAPTSPAPPAVPRARLPAAALLTSSREAPLIAHPSSAAGARASRS